MDREIQREMQRGIQREIYREIQSKILREIQKNTDDEKLAIMKTFVDREILCVPSLITHCEALLTLNRHFSGLLQSLH